MRGQLAATRALFRERARSLLGLLILIAVASAVMALRADTSDPQRVLGGALILVSFAMGPLLVAGTVSEDLDSGSLLFWLQKPVSPMRFYLGRLALALGAAMTASLALVLMGTAALAAAGIPEPFKLLRLVPFALPCTGLAGLVTFAFSGFGSRRDGTLTLLYLLLAVPGGLLLEITGPESAFLRALAWPILFPLNELQLLRGWLTEGSGWPLWPSLLRVAVYALTWLGLGTAATWRATRRPFDRGIL